jgi:hypothetical protein
MRLYCTLCENSDCAGRKYFWALDSQWCFTPWSTKVHLAKVRAGKTVAIWDGSRLIWFKALEDKPDADPY